MSGLPLQAYFFSLKIESVPILSGRAGDAGLRNRQTAALQLRIVVDERQGRIGRRERYSHSPPLQFYIPGVTLAGSRTKQEWIP